ncbi:MAG: LruC domain-containing protein [Bacteroides sp.]|nr:LruC domain-containing protein [Bacteroides sp.]
MPSTRLPPSLPDNDDAPKNEENHTTYYGTLAYEDLWTAMGDYDMNDVMVDYNCKVYKQIIGNKVYKIVDEFTPRHKGGVLHSGFGYQLHNIAPDDVRKITVEADGLTSKYMEGQMLEPGQSHPTIILFDDLSEALLGKTIKVTAELSDVSSANIVPPYNPFIFTHSEEGRGKEVHLPMYPPTDKADLSLFGTGRDGSRPEEEMYYVTAVWCNQYPYALNMIKVKDFPIPEEGVRIDVSYPKFRNWVESKGTEDKDWYKHPAQ